MTRVLERCSFEGETILDLGCGTGACAGGLASRCDRYCALDVSRPMLDRAKSAVGNAGTGGFVQGAAEALPLPGASIGAVFGSWFLTAVSEERSRVANDGEIERVVRSGGDVWALENHCTGGFVETRGVTEDPASWRHPTTEYGYEHVDVVETQFEFPTVAEAKRVFGFVFGERAVHRFEQNGDPTVGHHGHLLDKRV